MSAERDLLPLSALQHLVFCERQCALIHLEGQWQENPLTFEGRELHERVDWMAGESRGDVRIVRGLPLVHHDLGLTGRADVVELHRLAAGPGVTAARISGLRGCWGAFPVEYKRGRPKFHHADRVQLCAQALCLEEMWQAPVKAGALFYGKTRRREDIVFDSDLRRTTKDACHRLHTLVARGITPLAVFEPKCRRCSLRALCRPEVAGRSARRYFQRALRGAWEEL
jgi:CRISPR-associated exonuclease Cas4